MARKHVDNCDASMVMALDYGMSSKGHIPYGQLSHCISPNADFRFRQVSWATGHVLTWSSARYCVTPGSSLVSGLSCLTSRIAAPVR